VQVSTPRDLRSERGSILVLTTVLLPALVAVSAVALGVTTLWTSHLDGQRAVDLAALAGAANIPTASVDPAEQVTLPIPPRGTYLTNSLDRTFDPTDWQQRACAVLKDQLEGERSKVLQAAGDLSDIEPDCDEWLSESTTLAAMAACAGDILDVEGCADTFRSALTTTLPVLSSSVPAVTEAMAKAELVADKYTNRADVFLGAAEARALKTACLVRNALLGTCTLTLADRLLALGSSRLASAGLDPSGEMTYGVDLNTLLPAIMTPRVRVDLTGAKVRPMLSPFTFDLSASATARRTIKNVVVLPSLGVPANARIEKLEERFGPETLDVLGEPEDGQYIVDPYDVVNPADAVVAALDAIDEHEQLLMTGVVDAFEQAACRRQVSQFCPEIDDVVATETVREEFMQDLRDATTPPPDGTRPTVDEMLAAYADSGDAFWAAAPLEHRELREIYKNAGLSELELQAMALLNPALDALLSTFVLVPALDVVPVTVQRVTTTDPSRPIYVLRQVNPNDALATTGLYQARLVK
jgi:hypothetical protein